MKESDPASQGSSNPARISTPVVPRQLKWHGQLAAWLVHRTLIGIAFSLRLRYQPNAAADALMLERPVIFSIWHDRLALALPGYRRMVQGRRPNRRMAALVSASKDGALVARILEHFSAVPIRGSTSRRGSQALRELVAQAKVGHDLAITPDGPRGPRHQVQPGVIALAQLTGYPIVPANYELHGKVCLRSWDRFQIPLPLARWFVRVGNPVYVPEDANEAQRESLRQELERRMLDLVPNDVPPLERKRRPRRPL